MTRKMIEHNGTLIEETGVIVTTASTNYNHYNTNNDIQHPRNNYYNENNSSKNRHRKMTIGAMLLLSVFLCYTVHIDQEILNELSLTHQLNDSNRSRNTQLLEGSYNCPPNQHQDWPPTDMIDQIIQEANVNDAYTTTRNDATPIPRLIVAASNHDYVDFADNFANSLLRLNITNFVFVPLDVGAYTILSRAYPKHTLPIMPVTETESIVTDISGNVSFDTKEFQQLTSSRPKFITALLKKGYNIFYNDIDIVWKHNVWNEIDKRVHSSSSKGQNNSQLESIFWKDDEYQICTCLIYMLPTTSSIRLMQLWDSTIETDLYTNDQNAFDAVAKQLHFPIQYGGITYKNTTMIYLNDQQFPSGKTYWDNAMKKKNNVDKSVLAHNNYIIGKSKKKERFVQSGLWNPSGRLLFDTD